MQMRRAILIRVFKLTVARSDGEMKRKQTRTGARRSGDDYQDLVAAEAVLRVLRHPSRYRWVKFEAHEAGRLDDVLILRADGTVEATQVKFSTDALRPGDPWNWEKLLDQPKGGSSLIQAWCKSVALLDETYGATEPRLVSNRVAASDLLLTPRGYVDRNQTAPAVLEQIHSQLGDYSDDFLERFRFEVDEQDLPDLDETLLRQFQALGVSEENWLSLKEALRSWIRGERLPTTGEIRVDDIRYACGWRKLSQLPQNLEIPDDYTLPHQAFHDRFLERIDRGSGSMIVLTAGPGVGKSTYLSYLVQVLRELHQPVIRHHYSLRTSSDSAGRIDSRRVAESLMADIEIELRSYLGELSSQNPDTGALNLWLHRVGQQLVEEGRRLVVVVDGLDHVWRERESREELRRLFDHLLPVPPGIVVVVGTQPVEDRQLPPSLLNFEPRDHWIELPRLDRQAISQWLNHHRDLMPSEWNQYDHDWNSSDIATALYSRTGGHPLLNRYIVERIAGRGEHLTTDSLRAIPETPTDSVEDYYRALWVSLPEEAKDIVFLLAIAMFPWLEGGLFECLRLAGYDHASSTAGVAAVRHLLGRDAVGLWPFHSSILLYARQRQEFPARAPALREATIEWLKKMAPDYWRRSHLWLLQLEAGDSSPLLAGSDRRWAVEAIAAGHPLVEVERVLRAAAWEAIDRADFPTYVGRGVLADAVGESVSMDEALRWLFAAQLSLGTDDFLEPRAISGIMEFDDPQVLSLALHLHGQGKCAEAFHCFYEINRRLDRESKGLQQTEIPSERFEIVCELAGLLGVGHEKFTDFLAHFSSEDTKVSLAESWIKGLRRSRDVRSAILALGGPISHPIQRCLSRHVAVMCADEEIQLSRAERQLLAPPYDWVYQMSYEGQLDALPPEEPPPPDAVTDFALSEDYARTVGQYVHDLFFFLVVRELQSPGFGSHWAPHRSLRPWLASSLKSLAQGASNIAAGWRNAESIRVTAGYDSTLSLKNPPWDYGRADRRSADGVRRGLRTITEDLLVYRRRNGANAKLRWAEAETIASHNFGGFEQIVEWIAEGTVEIESEAIDNLCTSLDDELADIIEPFGERATTFSLLATVCARYGLRTKARHYLHRSSENLIAYGNHKDMLLNTALNAIESGAQQFETRQQLWFGLAPAIASVREFTDGDETSHLAARLGKLLLCFDQSLAIGFVKSLMDAEQYADVEEVLRDLVRTGDLADSAVGTLVSTCIDPYSIQLLEEREGASAPLAREVQALMPGFSANLAKRDMNSPVNTDFAQNAAGSTFESRGPDRHLDFPPERLDQLVRADALAWPPVARADELCAWLCRWAETEQAAEALNAVEPYFLEDDRLRVNSEAVAAVRKIGGRTRSYAWLVRSQRSNNGWYEYWTNSEEAKERWRSVKRDFPDHWHSFLVNSIRPPLGFSPHFGMTIVRLVEYLLFFERCDDAYAVASRLVDTVGELVSGQELPIPHWTDRTAECP